ncbi:MAG TPA: DUF5685 family protein [Microthrixaceae bacterium]|nr:DUF5685 family protein [Microthrixaceae bacterium]HMT23485.1 DUF5685 family protein [Microthrixaceae bacterium]HMT61454.1 DUF5685 family protein [Microthrixaceae bacterium]
MGFTFWDSEPDPLAAPGVHPGPISSHGNRLARVSVAAMYGLALAPCRHQPMTTAALDADRASWRQHMCGVCLAIRDEHGQRYRAILSTDAVLLSQIGEALSPAPLLTRRAGPCVLRGMRRAEVATNENPAVLEAARLNLVAVAERAADAATDGDGLIPRPLLRSAATRLARSASIDPPVHEAIGSLPRSLDEAFGPTESLYRSAFASLARSARASSDRGAAVGDLGAAYGRLTHVLDAIDDETSDITAGVVNPFVAHFREPGARLHAARSELRAAIERTDQACTSAGLDPTAAGRTIRRVLTRADRRLARPDRSRRVGGAVAALLGLTAATVAAGSPSRREDDRGYWSRLGDRFSCCCDCCDCCECIDCCDCCDCCDC